MLKNAIVAALVCFFYRPVLMCYFSRPHKVTFTCRVQILRCSTLSYLIALPKAEFGCCFVFAYIPCDTYIHILCALLLFLLPPPPYIAVVLLYFTLTCLKNNTSVACPKFRYFLRTYRKSVFHSGNIHAKSSTITVWS